MSKALITKTSTLILGLDVGTNSIGWCLVEGGKRIIATGVRIFEAGTMGTADQIAAGKDEPRNQGRRQARQARRLLWRRARRLTSTFKRLQEAELLPACDANEPAARHAALNALDRALTATHVPAGDTRAAHLLPYLLRRKALDERLDPHALGRALYHLAQRRGFLSNRKSAAKKDEDLGKVKSSIKTLAEEMTAARARTLGEYMTKLDPEAERLRGRWTSRQMYVDEFERIWEAQALHHPALLTREQRRAIRKAIFHQRPLQSQKHLVGRCALEPRSYRAAWPLLNAQRFRMLQRVNDLRVIGPESERLLTAEERAATLSALETEGDLKFTALRKLLGLPKGSSFNLEAGDEQKLPGNRTGAKVRKVLGARWDDMPTAEKDGLVQDLMSIQDDEALVRRCVRHWKLEEGTARELAHVGLEDGHCALSLRAVSKLLPLMEKGSPYMEARREAYPASKAVAEAADVLPRPEPIRNPIVERSLSQLRKVANAIVREYGKPAVVRVELARDLKKPRKFRELAAKSNREIQKEREEAAARIIKEGGIAQPKRSDIEKAMLWQECGGFCPYTGGSISFSSLFGPQPQYDVEHIVPYSRSLDDSFLNKTLCHIPENRNVKKNRTPFEAYAPDAARWEEILQRVKAFKGRAAREKLRRFKMNPEDVQEAFASFSSRQLQDTRYASVEAARYLGRLYGCSAEQPGVDVDGTRRVQVGAGQLTAVLRGEWGLNGILGDGGEKTREDHRHHAVDALVVALAEPGIVSALSAAAENAPAAKRRRFAPLPLSWPTLVEDARKAVDGIVVSHAVSKKVSGPLHEETLYSPPKKDAAGKTCAHVRKALQKLSKAEIARIVDPVVRKAVAGKAAELGGDPKKAFADAKNHPHLTAKDGRRIPIHKARVAVSEAATPIGAGARQRHVMTGANSHMEVFEARDKRGKACWEGRVVTLLEAAKRLKQTGRVVDRSWDDKKFLFSISGGETFAMLDNERNERLFRSRGIGLLRQAGRLYPRVDFAPLRDARTKEEMKADGAWKTMLLEPLRRAGLRKFTVDPLGRIRTSNE